MTYYIVYKVFGFYEKILHLLQNLKMKNNMIL